MGITMIFKYWLRKCGSTKPNTLCFGLNVGESVYEIALEDICDKNGWEHWQRQMTEKPWFTSAMLYFMLKSANQFHECDVRRVE
jgi:hypothetical protein